MGWRYKYGSFSIEIFLPREWMRIFKGEIVNAKQRGGPVLFLINLDIPELKGEEGRKRDFF